MSIQNLQFTMRFRSSPQSWQNYLDLHQFVYIPSPFCGLRTCPVQLAQGRPAAAPRRAAALGVERRL